MSSIGQDLLSLMSSNASLGASTGNNLASDLLKLVSLGSASTGASASASASASVSASAAASSSVEFLSQIEQTILRSTVPFEITETEELTVIGQRGVWLNRQEVEAWKGELDIKEYQIYEDPNPQVITKRIQEVLEYVQELAIRYLRPPTPPAPGEIIITQEPDIKTGPAPPLIIRQAAARAKTPEPLIIREAPPEAPKAIGPKRITISGKRLPPPPRKVVIERLAPLPDKPQNVIVERWLPYAETKRRVIFNKAAEIKAEVVNPRNVIIQWEAPRAEVRQEVKYLGVIRANPAEYVEKYGVDLKVHTELPQYVLDIKTPSDVGALAAGYTYKSVFDLEGALEGFTYVNLDSEGLSEYREQLLAKGIRDLGAASVAVSASASVSATASGSASASAVTSAALAVFKMIDRDNSGSVSLDEAESIVLKLNSKLKRSYGESEVHEFFKAVSSNGNDITEQEFVRAFEQLV